MRRKINNNYILGACLALLIILCLLSVGQPIRFQHEQAKREQAVKERLIQIKQAEERYRSKNGIYTGDFATLVKECYLASPLQYIPYSNGKKFSLAASTLVSKSGKQIPVMECGAAYSDFLGDLDEQAVQEVIDQANYAGLYPGLKIGDITTDNNNAGNWQ